jgi:hypothetical protein
VRKAWAPLPGVAIAPRWTSISTMCNVTGPEVMTFVCQLLCHRRGPLVLLWDGGAESSATRTFSDPFSTSADPESADGCDLSGGNRVMQVSVNG